MLAYLLNLTLQPAAFLVPATIAPVPILGLTLRSSPNKYPIAFHTLKWFPFCNPFVFTFMHGMGGAYPLRFLAAVFSAKNLLVYSRPDTQWNQKNEVEETPCAHR